MFDKSPERFIIKYSSLLLHLTLDFFSRFPLSRSPCFMCAFSVFRYHLCIILDPTHHGKRILVQRVACGFMGSDILSSSQEVPTDTNVGWNIYFHNSETINSLALCYRSWREENRSRFSFSSVRVFGELSLGFAISR